MIDYYNKVLDSKKRIVVSAIAKDLGMTANQLNLFYKYKIQLSYSIRNENKRRYSNKHQSSNLLVNFADSSLRRMGKSRDFVSGCSKMYIIGRTALGVLGIPIGIILALIANAETPFWGLVIGSAISFWGFAILARIHDAKILDKIEGKNI